MEVLTRRPRLYAQRSAKVKSRRSPKINIPKAIANGLTILCMIASMGLMIYGIYLAIPHIGYGIWLMLPCLAVATIIALLGASFQVFAEIRGDRHE
jgi:hypothetical protein